MHLRLSKFACLALTLGCVSLMPLAMTAQDTGNPSAPAPTADNPKPGGGEGAKASSKMPASDSPSKWDIFAGYSYLAPKGNVVPNDYPRSVNYGAIGSVARYFNNYVGVQVEGDYHNDKNEDVVNDDFSGGSAGLIFRFPSADLTPFVHALVGGESVGSYYYPNQWGVVLTVGGGMDYNTPFFNRRLAIRVFQADYQYTHEDFYPVGRGNFKIARLSAGVVFKVGTIAPPPPVTLSCAASPTSVFPGEPVTVTATAGMLNPKVHAIYTWSGQGVTGTDTTAKVDTTNLAAGSYTVNCGIKEGKPGKEGMKPWQVANGTTTFTVKEYEPPTLSCAVAPTTIKPGDSATVTSTGTSPQNRPLTYSYTAAAGTISGSGTTATFASTGAPTGPVAITCNVADDKGHNATSNTSVTIEAPPPPPQPHAQALCSINFENDKKRPGRVDNEAKACLDEVALDLQKQSDAKVVVIGESTADEKTMPKHHRKNAKMEDLAGQRAVNAKDYLVTEKGIDPSRITVVTGPTEGQKVEDYLVPAGADFNKDVTGTTPVDESVVKVQARKPLPPQHHGKRHAAKP